MPAVSLLRTLAAVIALLLVALPSDGQSGTPTTPGKLPKALASGKAAGVVLFSQNCATCHAHGDDGAQRAPSMTALEEMPPETIYAALTAGKMLTQARALDDSQKRLVAEFLGGHSMANADAAEAKNMPNQCSAGQAKAFSTKGRSWNGWGADLANSRFQGTSSAGLSANEVPQLKLRWAFGFPLASQAYSQPTVVGGRLYVGTDSGFVYALDAKTGCVYWSFRAKAGVRSAITIGETRGGPAVAAAYFADIQANVYALDADSGSSLWVTKIDEHPLAAILGSPALFERKLFVPVSSSEEAGSFSPQYSCCTFQGSLVALDAAKGLRIWKTYTISEKPQPTRKNSLGTQQFGPAGAAIWSAPTIDAKRRLIYVGTGDGYTVPAAGTTDSILAIALDSGKLVWSYQATKSDTWVVACYFDPSSESCPPGAGPDYDFGASPMLLHPRHGPEILLGAHKGGNVIAFDPARNGALVWSRALVSKPPSPMGEILFGGAADDGQAYYALNSGGMAAIDLRSGKLNWFTPVPPTESAKTRAGQSAAVTVIPGAVFSGGLDGVLHAFATGDGHEIWHVETAHEFATVNNVPAKGGSMGAPGPIVVDGFLYVGSGYIGTRSGMPGNVLLAFAP